jgi:hypothetical protein
MTLPVFTVLTQKEITIDLSRPAMQYIVAALEEVCNVDPGVTWTDSLQCELDNFVNLLHNLLERSEPKPENFDLIGA